VRPYPCDVDELPHINGIPPIKDTHVGEQLFVGWKYEYLLQSIKRLKNETNGSASEFMPFELRIMSF
jgi:hypothetical protein